MKRVIVRLVDDLDGSEAAETVAFALDGMGYTVDLSEGNASRFRDLLAPYVGAGSRVGRAGTSPFAKAAKASRGRDETRAVRAWWQANYQAAGLHEPTDRGRIPAEVAAAYRQHGGLPVRLVKARQAAAREAGRQAEADVAKATPTKAPAKVVPAAAFTPPAAEPKAAKAVPAKAPAPRKAAPRKAATAKAKG